MSTFDFPPSIASRPTYGTLTARAGTAQIMLADAEGPWALLTVAQADPELIRRAQVLADDRLRCQSRPKMTLAG